MLITPILLSVISPSASARYLITNPKLAEELSARVNTEKAKAGDIFSNINRIAQRVDFSATAGFEAQLKAEIERILGAAVSTDVTDITPVSLTAATILGISNEKYKLYKMNYAGSFSDTIYVAVEYNDTSTGKLNGVYVAFVGKTPKNTGTPQRVSYDSIKNDTTTTTGKPILVYRALTTDTDENSGLISIASVTSNLSSYGADVEYMIIGGEDTSEKVKIDLDTRLYHGEYDDSTTDTIGKEIITNG